MSKDGFSSRLVDWKRRNGHPLDAKVFSIVGGSFPTLRRCLTERGWVENEASDSLLWDLRWGLGRKHLGDFKALDDVQAVNHFDDTNVLTSKIGVCNSLYKCCTFDAGDVDTFFPRCFDITNHVEVELFEEDYKLTTCLCLLKRFVADGGHSVEAEDLPIPAFPRAAVRTALAVCQRRCLDVDAALDQAPGTSIEDHEWDVLADVSLKSPGQKLELSQRKDKLRRSLLGATTIAVSFATLPRSRSPNRKKSMTVARNATVDIGSLLAQVDHQDEHEHQEDSDSGGDDGDAGVDGGGDNNDEDESSPAAAGFAVAALSRCAEDDTLFKEAQVVLSRLSGQLSQFELDGVQNIWVLKPAGMSRGRGIQLSARLDKILAVGEGGGGKQGRWVAQKYIENPQLIEKKKFDIRLWVVVTSWNPLAAWFYLDCYIRFSFADYDPAKLKNRFAHLTNNDISKKAKDFEEHCDETMWHSDDYQEYLKKLPQSERAGYEAEDLWQDVVLPQLKQIVVQSLESVQDAVAPRTNAFELFGYDFMVSDDLRVWLLEVNCSPDLGGAGVSSKKTLVKAVQEDIVKVVVDIEKFGVRADRPRRKWDTDTVDSGRFELLEAGRRRQEERFRQTHGGNFGDTRELQLRGSKVQLHRPARKDFSADDVASSAQYPAALDK